MVTNRRVNGVDTGHRGVVGIGITTHNRRHLFTKALTKHRKYLPEGAELVIIDDASKQPVPEATYRFGRNVGIAAAKNKALDLLASKNVDHFFLFDDDTWPIAHDWEKLFIQSGQPHLTYTWGKPLRREGELLEFDHPNGCAMYVTRGVLDRVGGLDPDFGIWGHEHVSWSDRIYNAGFTRSRYQSPAGASEVIHASDEHGNVIPSVSSSIRGRINTKLYEAKRGSDEYIEYREDHMYDVIDLSILVPSVHTRRSTFGPAIQDQLFGQWEALPEKDRKRVEILMLTDNKTMTLGHKRNVMVEQAQGRYVQFVDDDDRVEPDMISSVLEGIDESGADVITFLVSVVYNGAEAKICRYSKDYERDQDTATEYHRLPNHLCVVKRGLARRCSFPSIQYQEDAAYSKLLRPLLHSEHAIDRVLYHYDFVEAQSETQPKINRPQVVARSEPASDARVDVVILSKASTRELKAMTQHTIDTCRSGANGLELSITVMEQEPKVTYKGARVMPSPGEFNYNQFANRGAAAGSAPWIMVANNDLEFEDGWLHHLLAADHPLVSPRDPTDRRQSGVSDNRTGWINGRFLSGWCFMISRELWEKIGGLDESVSFWCSDDVVIEQARAEGVRPMLVPAAIVRHLISQTHNPESGKDPDGLMTWAQVEIFNKKYGKKKFFTDSRYQEWRRARARKARVGR